MNDDQIKNSSAVNRKRTNYEASEFWNYVQVDFSKETISAFAKNGGLNDGSLFCSSQVEDALSIFNQWRLNLPGIETTD